MTFGYDTFNNDSEEPVGTDDLNYDQDKESDAEDSLVDIEKVQNYITDSTNLCGTNFHEEGSEHTIQPVTPRQVRSSIARSLSVACQYAAPL